MYCVYFHKNQDSEVFYIGQGRKARAFDKTTRNKKWKNEVEANPTFTIEIYKDNLSKKEAFDLESKLILELKPKCNIKLKQTLRIDIPVYFKELFYIDESSPSGLRHLKDNKGKNTKNKKIFGDIAGNIKYQIDGRFHGWQLMLNNKSYLVHRIIWSIANNTFDENYVIDHIDQNPLNNCVSNLREVSYKLNANNTKIRSNNLTGIKNLFIVNSKYKAYCGQKWLDGVRTQKSFSFRKYGEEQAKQLALDYLNS